MLVLGCAVVGRAQYTISTLAGNGPPNGSLAILYAMSPVGVAVDANQNVYIPSSAGNCVYLVSSGGSTSQVVGMGSRGYGGDGGPATSALLSGPLSVALDSQGNNLYIADSFNNVIRKVTINGGTITTITTVAGNGTQGSGGDGKAATSAQLNYPEAVAVDSAGNIYIADTHNNVIREVEVSGGTINTVAPPGVTFSAPAAVAVNGLDLYIADTGNSVIWELSDSGWSVVAGISGKPGFNGDTTVTNGITPVTAQLNQPSGVAVDGLGNIYIGDTYNERIRKVIGNTIETVAGNGNYGHTGSGLATLAMLAGPAGVTLDTANNIYIVDSFRQYVDVVNLGTGIISTLAGNGAYQYSGDNGLAVNAQLNQPAGVAVDDVRGLVYIADTYNNRIRQVNLGNHEIITIAGNGTQGFNPNAQYAAGSQLNLPSGVAVDSDGNLYIADTFNHVIEKVVMSNGSPTTFTVVAGNNKPGFNGDGPATSAELSYPWAVAVDGQGNLYIADTSNCRIREVSNSNITTLAGGTCGYNAGPAGATAEFSDPSGVAVDANGVVYVADTFNGLIRTLTASTTTPGTYDVSTVAGGCCSGTSDGVPATSASLGNPYSVAVDSSGNMYIAETNGFQAIRIVANGIITTIAGTGVPGFSGDGGPATLAEINRPFAVAVGSNSRNVFIADYNNSRIRELAPVATTTLAISGPTLLTPGIVNVTYLPTTMMATGGTGSYTWGATGLPAGMSIGHTSGTISGAPGTNTNTGSPFTVVVTVTDSSLATANFTYTLVIYVTNTCDPTGSGTVDASSVQEGINEALGKAPVINFLDPNGVVNVAVVQALISAALGRGCLIGGRPLP